MSVLSDIPASYRRPRAVMRRLLDAGQREDRALAILMAACVLLFVGRWPAIAREAYLTGQDRAMLMGGSLLATVIIAPLLFYVLAFVSFGIARLLGGKGTAYGARLALFWSLLASGPFLLFHGIVEGYFGKGPELKLAGALWLAVFLWIWLSCLFEAQKAGGR